MITDKKRITRNLILFSMATVASGWAGLWLNTSQGITDHTDSPGMGLWLVTPFLVSLLLRLFGKDGWKDIALMPKLKGNGKWYAFVFLFFPIVSFVILFAGMLAGLVTFNSEKTLSAMFYAMGVNFALMFGKNIFEEFSWRGYLAPRLRESGINDFAAYSITGVVWSSWHIPYWAYFLPAEMIAKYAPYSLAEFILLGLLGMSAASVLFNEIRFITGTIWPAVILHNMVNVVSLTLLLNEYIHLQYSLLFTPGVEGIFMTLFILSAGILLRKYRLDKAV